MLNKNEEVFVIPYQHTMDIENGFTKERDNKTIWSRYDYIGRYIAKDEVEDKVILQQLIPYIIIRSDKMNYFTLQMTNPKKKEYKNTMSIGISDHIKYEDGLKEPLLKASVRTLLEHVHLATLQPLIFKGYVREMNDSIKGHLGIVLLIDNIPEDSIVLQTTDFVGEWKSKKELIEHYGKMEIWSKHIINYMVDNVL